MKLTAILIPALLVSACGGADYGSLGETSFDVASQSGAVTAHVDLGTGQPVRGENRLYLSFTPESAAVEVTGASATHSASGTESSGTVRSGELGPELSVRLPEYGTWEVVVELSVDDEPDALAFPLEVEP